MYICIICKENKGIVKCNICGTLYCEWCEELDSLHELEDHEQIYDLYDYLDALKERNLYLSADANGDDRANYL